MDPARLVSLFNPDEALAPGDERWLDLDDVTGQRGILRGLTRKIMLDGARGVWSLQGVSGLRGSGKSTLLNRLKDSLAEVGRYEVLRLDFSDHVLVQGVPQAVELLALCLAKLSKALNIRRGLAGNAPVLSDRVLDFLKVLLPDASNRPVGPDTISWSLGPGGGQVGRFRNLEQDRLNDAVRLGADAVNELIEAILATGDATQLVMVLDGLEKYVPSGDVAQGELRQLEGLMTRLLEGHIPNFGLRCHLVVTIPPGMIAGNTRLREIYDPWIIPMVKVRDMHREAQEPGIERMIDLVQRRHPDALATLFGDRSNPSLRRLVRMTGGFIRALILLVQRAIYRNDEDIYPIPARVWEQVLKDYLSDTRLGANQHPPVLRVLRELDQDPNQRDATRYKLQHAEAAAFALNVGLVLGYQNDDRWYDVHPAFEGDDRLHPDFVLDAPASEVKAG